MDNESQSNEAPLFRWECALCHGVPLLPCVAPCGHVYCKECLEDFLVNIGTYCPDCGKGFKARAVLELQPAKRTAPEDEASEEKVNYTMKKAKNTQNAPGVKDLAVSDDNVILDDLPLPIIPTLMETAGYNASDNGQSCPPYDFHTLEQSLLAEENTVAEESELRELIDWSDFVDDIKVA